MLAGESYNLGGDIIVQADKSPVASLDRLRDVVATKKPGDKLRLVVYRNGKRTIVEREARTATGCEVGMSRPPADPLTPGGRSRR